MAWENKKWRVEGITDDKLNARIRDNMNALKAPPTDVYSAPYVASPPPAPIDTTSTSFVDLSSDYVLSITTTGGDIFCMFSANNVGTTYFDIELDGARQGGVDGILAVANSRHVALHWCIQNVPVGTHEIKMKWKTGGSQSYILDTYPAQFWIREIS